MAAQSQRQKKKDEQVTKCLRMFMEWLADFRGYLLEADHENIDLRIIKRQFKRKLKRLPKGWWSVTRMEGYAKTALSRDI